MYWCEGDRSQESRTYRVALTSSDSKILQLFVQWLEQYYGAKKLELKVRLHVWPDSDEVAAKRYWSSQLGVSLGNFTKSWIKPRGQELESVFIPTVSAECQFHRRNFYNA